MQSNRVKSALFAGIIGSLAMLFFLYAVRFLGGPNLNILREMSTVSSTSSWWAQPLEYFVLGAIVFPLLYAKLVFTDLNGAPWFRGLKWGLLLWVLRGIIVMPVMDQGFFSMHSQHAAASVIETFVGHAMYGLLLGLIAGDMSNRNSKIQRVVCAARQ